MEFGLAGDLKIPSKFQIVAWSVPLIFTETEGKGSPEAASLTVPLTWAFDMKPIRTNNADRVGLRSSLVIVISTIIRAKLQISLKVHRTICGFFQQESAFRLIIDGEY